MIKQCDEVALFQKMKKMKSDIENVKSVDVTSLPSATYNRKNVGCTPHMCLMFSARGSIYVKHILFGELNGKKYTIF
jgi:hypothetical protein